MKSKLARGLGLMTLLTMGIALSACSAPADEPTMQVTPEATAVDQAALPTPTLEPSPVPPTATPARPRISLGNVWDLQPLYVYPDLGNSIRAVALDSTGGYLAAVTGGSSRGYDHRLRLWSTETGELIAQSEEYGIDTWDVAFNPGGDRIAIGLQDGRLILYSVPELELITTFNHSGQVNSVAFSPDGAYLAAGVAETDGGHIYLWNIDQAVLVRRTWAHPYSVPSVTFSSNGQYLASGAVDRTVKIWQVSNGQLVRTLDQAGQGTSVSFSPGGEWLGSAMCAQSTVSLKCVDGQVWLWDVSNWTLQTKLMGPIDWVDAMAFTQDGAIVAGGGRDFSIYLWEQSTGLMLRSLIGHQGAVLALDLSPEGRYLASGATDDSVILWAISP